MEKAELKEDNTKSSRMVGYLAAAVALLALAFIVLIACSTYLIENQACEDKVTETSVSNPAVAQPEKCEEYFFESSIANISFTEHTTVCPDTKTEFGFVRDKTTGHVIDVFFSDYIEQVKVVYLAQSNECLLTHDMSNDDFDRDLDDYRNDRYMQGPYEYGVGESVEAWQEIPEKMRGYCSPQNTKRLLEHAADSSEGDDHERNKRHGVHYCCCYYIAWGQWRVTYACGNSITCTFGSSCLYVGYGHLTYCSHSNAYSTCVALFCAATPYC